jgi:hypothetical protein
MPVLTRSNDISGHARAEETGRVFDQLSDAARAVAVVRRTPEEDAPEPYGGDEARFELGKTAIGARISGDTLTALYGTTAAADIRDGAPLAVLQRAVKYAADNGLHFQTLDFVCPEAATFFHALAKRGYPVTVNGFVVPPREPLIEVDTTGRGLPPTGPDDPIWGVVARPRPWAA